MDNSPTRFVVFTTQRSGSTWLMSILNGLDGVSAQGELFLPRPRSPETRWDSDFALPRYLESRKTHGSVRPFSVYSYLSALYNGDGWIGFKLMYSQLRRYPEILPYLMRKRVRVVHLVRRNHLDVLISFAVKREIGKAHILSPEDRPGDVRIELDTTSLHRELRKLERRHTMGRTVLRLARLSHVEVAYEDLVADPARFARIQTFLGIPAEGIPRSNILRTRTEGQAQVVANYDDVRATLEGSRFAALLDGGSPR
ncbi:MAG: sulfotransferase [Gaiellaceae bacterium]